jgi:hypothetical protein
MPTLSAEENANIFLPETKAPHHPPPLVVGENITAFFTVCLEEDLFFR